MVKDHYNLKFNVNANNLLIANLTQIKRNGLIYALINAYIVDLLQINWKRMDIDGEFAIFMLNNLALVM